MADYIPSSDTNFLAWAQNFSTYAADHFGELGILLADTAPVVTAVTAYDTALTANITKQNDARAAKIAKDTARDTLEAAVRSLVRRLQASPQVDDTERAALGITVPDLLHAMDGGTVTRPLGMIDTSQRLRHEIRFVDETNPTSRAKPKGALGCEVWVKISAQGEPAPTDPSQLSFLALDTASPYVAEYDGANGGKVAHYMLRWALSEGAKGPWSETASATIVG